MNTFVKVAGWLRERDRLTIGKSVGFVPTMGALHDGHLSLIRRAKAENDLAVLSIFVNPTQFNNSSDFEKYPLSVETDLKKAQSAGCDLVLLPDRAQMYPDDYRYRVSESTFSKVLCGAHRPGHFDGVLTVVLKLLSLAKANRAYFGEKDYQQLELIREMARSFFLATEILASPTVREPDGLAMSSRNLRLTSEHRLLAPEIALTIARSLREKQKPQVAREQLESKGFKVDYVEDHIVGSPAVNRRFVAAFLGEIRLIDNMTESDANRFAGATT